MNFHHSNNSIPQIPVLVTFFLFLCFFSCESDLDRSFSSSLISFTPEVNSSWTLLSRSDSETNTSSGSVTSMEGSTNTPLYLHTNCTDSITTPLPLIKNGSSTATRNTPMIIGKLNSFGVSGYSYTGSWNENKTPNYMYDVTVNKSGNNYALSYKYYWPGASYKMKFFAYAPKGNPAYMLSGAKTIGSPRITCTIPADVSKQEDLLVAASSELTGNYNSGVTLAFNHVLTAVKFTCGSDMQAGIVKSITLKNIQSKGTYNMYTKSWSLLSVPTKFSQTLNKTTTGTANEQLTTEAQTFMLLPQILPDNAQIEVLFNDGFTEYTLTANIGGTEWPMGKTVTYKLSTSSISWEYILNVAGPSEFSYTGGTNTYSITSYRKNGQAKKEPIAWATQYSTDNGANWSNNKPDWLTAFTTSGAGSLTPTICNATVNTQNPIFSSPSALDLQSAAYKGQASTPYNLSNREGAATVENTANCYVANSPGIYSIPLVYGNAIKNGVTNRSAYTSTVTGSTILSRFINHLGNGITDPYIYNNTDCKAADCKLIWQDANSLVSDLKLSQDKQSLIFTINKNTICEGNAVVAVRDAKGNVMWSWHIWVTNENLERTIEVINHENKRYKLMRVNLGWCKENVATYRERTCKVRFTAGNLTKEIAIKQNAETISSGNDCLYYQWGRKDPFLSFEKPNSTNKIWYDSWGNVSTDRFEIGSFPPADECIKNCILKPNISNFRTGMDNTYSNLWSTNSTLESGNDNNIIKTIYDPCPTGFHLPAYKVFSGFILTGKGAEELAYINGNWDFTNNGMNFNTNSSKEKTIFFPASRAYPNANPDPFGCYWSASPGDNLLYGYMMIFEMLSVIIDTPSYRLIECGVRACQE